MNTRIIKLLGIEAGQGGPTPGAGDGPYVLREQGLVKRLEQRGLHVEDLGDIPGIYETRFASTVAGNVNNLLNVLQVNRHTHACVLGTRRKSPDAFLLIIGGDHSLAIGTLAGLSDACERLGLIWIDAHADFNTPASSPSGNLHGMSLAIACGQGVRELRHIADRDPMVEEEDVYLFGCRELDEGEARSLARSRITMASMDEFRQAGAASTAAAACRVLAARCDHIHLSFDIDVLDPQFAPATGTPVRGGLTADEARAVLAALGQTGLIRSAEFVEFNPELDRSGRTGALVMELIETLLGEGRIG